METIDINEVFAQANVVENLKNFAGVDAQNALSMMTPERLAAVVGGLQRESNAYKFKPNAQGWYRLFKFHSGSYGLFFLFKNWATGEPAPALVSFNRYGISVLLRTENTGNNIQKVRVMKDGSIYYFDVWYEKSEGAISNEFTVDSIRKEYCTFMKAEPIEDTTSTLVKEVSLV